MALRIVLQCQQGREGGPLGISQTSSRGVFHSLDPLEEVGLDLRGWVKRQRLHYSVCEAIRWQVSHGASSALLQRWNGRPP